MKKTFFIFLAIVLINKFDICLAQGPGAPDIPNLIVPDPVWPDDPDPPEPEPTDAPQPTDVPPPPPPCIPCSDTCSSLSPRPPCSCSACPSSSKLNCSGCEAKCGQTCPQRQSCQVPACPGPGCQNTSVTVCRPASNADAGPAAVPSSVVLRANTQEKSVNQSILEVEFVLGANSWITDYCDVTLYKGYSPIQTHQVGVAPQCAVKTFVSKEIRESFVVPYGSTSSGVYSVGVKCYNTTCG